MSVPKIDYVLVSSSLRSNENYTFSLEEARNSFEERLIQDEELQLERETYGSLTFVKLHAPNKVLKKYCEIMKFRMPLRKKAVMRGMRMLSSQEMESIFTRIRTFSREVMNYFVHGDISSYELIKMNDELKATYSSQKGYLFLENDLNFFTPPVRTLIVRYILNRQIVKPYANDEPIQLERLINDDVYIAAYPLHDGHYERDNSTRKELFESWCQLSNWYRNQPLDKVQEYLGTKEAFYFAWLGFYMRFLIPASICGVLVLLYGLCTLSGDRVSQDVCNSRNVTMCPSCDYTCDYYPLSANCLYSKITHLFDNPFTVVFAFLMAVWASTFLELWKRYDALLTYRWSLADYTVDEELPRLEYLREARRFEETKTNVVTGKQEPVVPLWKYQLPITIFSYTTICFFIMLIVIAVAAVLIYRMWVTAVINAMSYTSILKQHESVFISSTSASLNLISIMVLNAVYMKIAKYLTDLEIHRTATEQENALTIKIFMFQFINYYSSIMYIAFFKGKFIGFPGNYWRIFGARQEECSYGGCLLELSIQLAFIMVGKQLLSASSEISAPTFEKILRSFMSKEKSSDSYVQTEARDLAQAPDNIRWIEDFKLLTRESVGLFPEYLKMVIQFGFVTLFVPAFPLAPLFAFINNIFQVRIDAKKILTCYRKPVPYQVPGIGVWFSILQFIGSLAVLTNGIVIAFSSNFIPKFVYMINNQGKYENFLNNSLSVVNVADLESTTRPVNSTYDNISFCCYSDFRYPPSSAMKYTPTHLYWQVFIARLIFIVLFQNITYAVKSFIDYCIPDKPKILQQLIRKEKYETVKLIIAHEFDKSKELVPSGNIYDPSSISTGEPSDSYFIDSLSSDLSLQSELPNYTPYATTSSSETAENKMKTFPSTSTTPQQ